MKTLQHYYEELNSPEVTEVRETPSQEYFDQRVHLLSMFYLENPSLEKFWITLNGVYIFPWESDDRQAWYFKETWIYTYKDQGVRDLDFNNRPMELLMFPTLYTEKDYKENAPYLRTGRGFIRPSDHITDPKNPKPPRFVYPAPPKIEDNKG